MSRRTAVVLSALARPHRSPGRHNDESADEFVVPVDLPGYLARSSVFTFTTASGT